MFSNPSETKANKIDTRVRKRNINLLTNPGHLEM